jgi:hypothetical protein
VTDLAELERLHGAATAAAKELEAFDAEHNCSEPFTAAFEEEAKLDNECGRAEAALWAAAQAQLGDLLKQSRLAATLTSILCTESRHEPVERLRWLIDENGRNRKRWWDYEQNYILPCFKWATECGIDLDQLVREKAGKNCVELLADSLRAALTAKDAELQNAKHGHYGVLNDRDRLAGDLARMKERVAELEKQAEEASEQASMACEDPRDDCTCAGCSYARDVYAKMEKP